MMETTVALDASKPGRRVRVSSARAAFDPDAPHRRARIIVWLDLTGFACDDIELRDVLVLCDDEVVARLPLRQNDMSLSAQLRGVACLLDDGVRNRELGQLPVAPLQVQVWIGVHGSEAAYGSVPAPLIVKRRGHDSGVFTRL